MTSKELPAYRRASRSQPCPHCAAEIGEPCRGKSGRATYDHAARSRITQAAQNVGYEDGLKDALALLDWQVRKSGVNTTVEQVRKELAEQHEMVRRSNLRDEANR